MGSVLTGLDRVLQEGVRLPGQGRFGLLCNASTLSRQWIPTAEALHDLAGGRLARIFSPQHGFMAEKQDNMIESADTVHPLLHVPIVSLYGRRRDPAPGTLADLDALLIDIQDVGTRVYTFLNTALLCLQRAAEAGLPVIVLDRPNPLGSRREGPVLTAGFTSFVGLLDIPLRHGLTAGELCRYGAWRLGLPGRGSGFLDVVPLSGWSPSPEGTHSYHDQTGLPWVSPSPNMPTLESAIVYPGQVALEGTNLSEGRGTTRPFEYCGAAYVDPAAVRDTLRNWGCLAGESRPASSGPRSTAWGREGSVLDGLMLREIAYEPTFHKDAGESVRGFQLHVMDRNRYRPVAASVALIAAIRACHAEAFAWAEPPYEYEHDRLPIDLIFGTDEVRRAIEEGLAPDAIAGRWTGSVEAFEKRVGPHLLYR